jgi:gamma-glutamylcyclotransferase (GGCT)/AIG2-like uncharacterized protein YtfP
MTTRKRRKTFAVFAYGTLRTRFDTPAAVPGRIYARRGSGLATADFDDAHPAAGPSGSLVRGEVRRVSPRTLSEWDRREGHPRLYERIVVKTTAGQICYAYQWRQGFGSCVELPDGEWSWIRAAEALGR